MVASLEARSWLLLGLLLGVLTGGGVGRHPWSTDTTGDSTVEDTTGSGDVTTSHWDVTSRSDAVTNTDDMTSTDGVTYNDVVTKHPLLPSVLISANSLTSLCYAQCMAECLDAKTHFGFRNETLFALNDTRIKDHILDPLQTRVCMVQCIKYESSDWVKHCKNNTVCLEKCHDLRNQSAEGRSPAIPKVVLYQSAPRYVKLSWPQLAGTGTGTGTGTVFYVIESSDDQGKTWTKVAKISDSSLEVELDVCSRRMYRVASVSRYGSKGFSADSTVTRSILPSPGTPVAMQVIGKVYDPEIKYFYAFAKWDPPRAWIPQDVRSYQMFDRMTKRCKHTLVPPVPHVDNIEQVSRNSTTMFAKIRIFHMGYGCVYSTPVKAISKCGAVGEPVDLIIDLLDCKEIPGFPCPTIPPMIPTDVTNVTCVTDNETMSVLVRWAPPPEHVDMYIVQWGIISQSGSISAYRTLVELGRRRVPGNSSEVRIHVNSITGVYGVKILPALNNSENHNMSLSLSGFATTFTFNQDMDTGKTDKGEPGSSTVTTVGPKHMRFSPPGGSSNQLYIGVPLAAFVVFLALVSVHQGARLRRRKKRAPQSTTTGPCNLNDTKNLDQGFLVDNPLYTSSDPWEIPRQRLKLGEVLGKGAFGQVVVGELLTATSTGVKDGHNVNQDKSTKVAVKMLLDGADDSLTTDFEREIELMKTIGCHSHVVSMVGCCTLTAPLCLVVEYMITDLLHYLRRHRHSILEHVSEEDRLCLQDLLSFARQIAIGMEYLSQKGFVHRDLATRNVLVGDHKTVKIGDFGLTRYVYDDHVYVTRRGKRLPLKWMALEAIFDLVFTTQTDVWAYGVLMYELMTLGGVPYPTVSNKDLLRRLQVGYRLERPDTCPISLYEVMLSCWRREPSNRPTFTQLRSQVEALMEQEVTTHYITICPTLADVTHDDVTTDDDITSDDITLGDDVTCGVHIISDDEDDVFGITVDSGSCSGTLGGDDFGSSCSFRGYQTSDSSGVSSCLPSSPSELVCPVKGEELLLVARTRDLTTPLDHDQTQGRGWNQVHFGHHQRVVGKRQDEQRVSTCSQTRLLSSSFSEGFFSDDGVGLSGLSISERGETYL